MELYFYNYRTILPQLCKYTSIAIGGNFRLQYNYNNITKKKITRSLRERDFLSKISRGFFPRIDNSINELGQPYNYSSIFI